MALETWLAFFTATWLISLSPGAGAVAAMAAGLQHGFARAYWLTLGLQLALLLHIAVVAAGVGALLTASEWAFTAIKWFGVVYLLYLGWQQWRSAPKVLDLSGAAPAAHSRRALVWRGFLVNASNPKSIIFIMAVVPQFLDAQRAMPQQYLLMAVTMVAVDLVVMAGYTSLAARVLRYLRSPSHQAVLNRVFGGFFVLAAGVLATFRQAAR